MSNDSYFSDKAMGLKKEIDSLFPAILTLRHSLTMEGLNVDTGSFMTDLEKGLETARDFLADEKERLESIGQSLRRSQADASSGPNV